MKKSDARIQKTNHNTPINSTETVVNEQNNTVNSVANYPTPHPCDEGDTPAVPDKPKPNPNRPKTNNQPKTDLIYTDGVQKVGNVVSVKVNPDSTISYALKYEKNEINETPGLFVFLIDQIK